jgi:multisubunit Na+/H+ antiporter MnhB subunit
MNTAIMELATKPNIALLAFTIMFIIGFVMKNKVSSTETQVSEKEKETPDALRWIGLVGIFCVIAYKYVPGLMDRKMKQY